MNVHLILRGVVGASRSIFGDSLHFFVVTCQPYDGAKWWKNKNSVYHPESAKLLQSLPCQARRGFSVCGGSVFLNVLWSM